MYPDLYKGLNLKPEDLPAYDSLLVSFKGKIVTPRGQIRLLVQTSSNVVKVDFIVVDAYSPYMAIMARPWLHALEAFSSTLYQNVKYPSNSQVKEIVGNQSMAKQCMVVAILHRPNTESSTSIERNVDVFAWNAYEAPGVDLSFICHHLNVNPFVSPKKQPPRRSSREHSNVVKDEVTKLKQAGAIKEVFYLE